MNRHKYQFNKVMGVAGWAILITIVGLFSLVLLSGLTLPTSARSISQPDSFCEIAPVCRHNRNSGLWERLSPRMLVLNDIYTGRVKYYIYGMVSRDYFKALEAKMTNLGVELIPRGCVLGTVQHQRDTAYNRVVAQAKPEIQREIEKMR